MLRRHAAAIDISNRAGIRRLLMQLTEEHFRNKPPAALVTATDRERLVEILFDDVIGLGPLEAPLRDPDITEIMVNRPEQIFVERRGRIELTNLAFEDEASLRRVIDRIVSTIGRRVDESEPMCDARLKDGSRVNVVIPPVAIYGPCLTIRKFGREVLTPERIVAAGGSSEAILEYLDAAVKSRLNVIVSGGMGSGKTTLLNVLSGFIPSDERIVTCEDAVELRLRQVHVISLESKLVNVEGRGQIRMGLAMVSHRVCTAGQGCHACASKCPTKALSMDFDTQRLVVTADRCVGCGLCEQVCRTVNDHVAIRVTPVRLLAQPLS